MPPPFRKIMTTTALCLAAVGLNSCQTVEQRMISELSESMGDFDADSLYAAYVKQYNGESARRLRKAAADAAMIRICVGGGNIEMEYYPLADDEAAAVREVLAEIEEAPALNYSTWLEEQHDQRFGPQPFSPLYWCTMEFVADDGHVLHTFYGFDSDLGDVSKAAEYRTNAYRPAYMLPAVSLNRWKSLPFHARTKARLRELHKNH